jgi:hypothetical protein
MIAMYDSYDENASIDGDEGLSLDLIEEEILAGLPLHADRLVAAFDAEEYYQGRNEPYIPRRSSEEWLDYLERPKRCSKITRKVVRALTQDLYSPGPTRKLANKDADAWLQDVYEKNHINALMQQADRKATLNALCAIQVTATGRPEKPIQLSLWGAHEMVWWTWPDDPTEAWAVCTIARERRLGRNGLQHRLRLEAWSRDEHRYYLTQYRDCPCAENWTRDGYRSLFGQPASFVPELSGYPAGEGNAANPYGCLPFAFATDEMPVTRLDEGGIGPMLMLCNREVDRELSDLAQNVKEYMTPIGFARGVPANFRVEKRPGGFQILTPSKGVAEGEQPTEPTLAYLQAGMNVEHVWANILNYANNTLEEMDVPITAVRLDASTDLSGVAIMAKQLPLMRRTNARRQPFGKTEADLARVVLTAAGNFYEDKTLLAAAREPGTDLTWPDSAFPVLSRERDEATVFELDNHLKSLIMVYAERNGCTREQAIDGLKQIRDDNDLVRKLLPPPETEAVGPRASQIGNPNPVVQDAGQVKLLDATGQPGDPVKPGE